MESNLKPLDYLGNAIAEATTLYGAEWPKVKAHVEARLSELGEPERRAIDAAASKILSFRAPDWPLGRTQ